MPIPRAKKQQTVLRRSTWPTHKQQHTKQDCLNLRPQESIPIHWCSVLDYNIIWHVSRGRSCCPLSAWRAWLCGRPVRRCEAFRNNGLTTASLTMFRRLGGCLTPFMTEKARPCACPGWWYGSCPRITTCPSTAAAHPPPWTRETRQQRHGNDTAQKKKKEMTSFPWEEQKGTSRSNSKTKTAQQKLHPSAETEHAPLSAVGTKTGIRRRPVAARTHTTAPAGDGGSR